MCHGLTGCKSRRGHHTRAQTKTLNLCSLQEQSLHDCVNERVVCLASKHISHLGERRPRKIIYYTNILSASTTQCSDSCFFRLMFQWDGELMNKWYTAYAIAWFFWMYENGSMYAGMLLAVLGIQQSYSLLSSGGKEKDKKKQRWQSWKPYSHQRGGNPQHFCMFWVSLATFRWYGLTIGKVGATPTQSKVAVDQQNVVLPLLRMPMKRESSWGQCDHKRQEETPKILPNQALLICSNTKQKLGSKSCPLLVSVRAIFSSLLLVSSYKVACKIEVMNNLPITFLLGSAFGHLHKHFFTNITVVSSILGVR